MKYKLIHSVSYKSCLATLLSLLLASSACTSKKTNSLSGSGNSVDQSTEEVAATASPYDSTTMGSNVQSTSSQLPSNIFDSGTQETDPKTTASTSTIGQTTAEMPKTNCATVESEDMANPSGCTLTPADINAWFDVATQRFQYIGFCFDQVVKLTKQILSGRTTVAPADMKTIYEAAGKALGRCYDRILEKQQAVANWNAQQEAAKRQKQQQLSLLLSLLSQFNSGDSNDNSNSNSNNSNSGSGSSSCCNGGW